MATDEHFQDECEVGYSLWTLPFDLWESPYIDEEEALRVLANSSISESEVKAVLMLKDTAFKSSGTSQTHLTYVKLD